MEITTATVRSDRLAEGDIIYHAFGDLEALVISVTPDEGCVYVETTGGQSGWYPNEAKVTVLR